jgi:hypothetical protein
MAELTPEIRAQLNETITEWAEKFIYQRKKAIERKQMRASGDLSRSMRYSVTKDAINDVRDLFVQFAEQGRWMDMKNMRRANGGEEYVKAIMDWMDAKGLTSDMILKWWSDNNYRKIPSTIKNQIAWGIIKSRANKIKRQKWYNASKTAAVNELHHRIGNALLPKVEGEVKKMFEPIRLLKSEKWVVKYSQAKGRS